MDNTTLAPSGFDGISLVIGILRSQLGELDRMGANKAAAHLDASIQQLTRDYPGSTDSDPRLRLVKFENFAET